MGLEVIPKRRHEKNFGTQKNFSILERILEPRKNLEPSKRIPQFMNCKCLLDSSGRDHSKREKQTPNRIPAKGI